MEIILSIIAIILCINFGIRLSKVEKLLSQKFASEFKKKAEETEEAEDIENEEEDLGKYSNKKLEKSYFVNWLKTDSLMKLGAFLLLLGFGWLVSYAFMNNWIGPIGRISFGLVVGILIIAFGEWRIKTYRNQGAVLLGLGASIDLLTIFAAREIYNFFNPAIALTVMALVVVFIGFSSIKNKSLSLAILGIILGGIAPLFTNTLNPTFIGLFSYLFVLTVSILWVIKITGWRILSLISLIVIFIYSIPYFIPFLSKVEDTNIAIISAFLFAILFYIANLLVIISTKKATITDLITAGLNGILLLLWINTVVPVEWQSIVTVISSLIFVLCAFIVFDKTKLKQAMFIYSGLAVVFVATAAAFELEGSALTIAYIIEAGLVVLISNYLFKNPKLDFKVSFLFILPILMAFRSIDSRLWQTSVFHKDFFVLLTMIVVTFFLGVYFYKYKKSNKEENLSHGLMLFYLITGIFYTVVLIWESIYAAIENQDTASMTLLLIYTIFGLYFYIRNKFRSNRFFKILGYFLLALVVARLLIVEVWNMEISGKIITFSSIGVLLISTAFIGNKKK
jgi:uncharacterized membrane protein